MTDYTCPMHPSVRKSAPGLCPECGMKLVKSEGQHAMHNGPQFIRRLLICAGLSVPIILYAEIITVLTGWAPPDFPLRPYLILFLATIVFIYGGGIFIRGALSEMRNRSAGMMTLISLAISAAFLYSIYATIASIPTLFWELSTLILVMLLGHYMEMRAVKGARGALAELAKLLPDSAEVIRNKKTIKISLSELKTGDIVVIKPGGKVPADGKIIEGQTSLDESIVTGESQPINKKKGDSVIAGTINGDGSIKVEVMGVGEKTFLASVQRLVEQAQQSKSKTQILSDKAAFALTIIAISAGIITGISWLIAGSGVGTALTRLVAVLVIACPHALGLAVPLVAAISTNKAANNGFIVKQRLALEGARTVDTVLFDKTGTLTKGEFGIDTIVPAKGQKQSEVLRLAASVNQDSEHSIAKAIVAHAKQKRMKLAKIGAFKRIPGKGAQAKVGTKTVKVGSDALLKTVLRNPSLDKLAKQGKTIIHVIAGNTLVGSIALADIIREESKLAIAALHEKGIQVAMITGDSEPVAKWVAGQLAIDTYFARVLPEDKVKKVKLLQSQGKKVAMVGDGVNDAPALTQADLGIAIGAGTNVAIESAGIILVKNNPMDIPKVIQLSKLTYAKMMQNLFWATGYNVVALPLAAGVLAFKGIILQPAVAALLMSISTVIVAINAMLLRRRKLSND